MGQQHLLCIVFIVQYTFNCFGLESFSSMSRRPQNIQSSPGKHYNERNFRMVKFFWKNLKASTAQDQRNRRHISYISHYSFQSTTPSYIEFYYLNDYEDLTKITRAGYKRLDRLITDNEISKLEDSKISKTLIAPSLPFISFRLNGPHINGVVTPRKLNILRSFQKSALYPHVQPVDNSNEKVHKREQKKKGSLYTNKTIVSTNLVTKVYSNDSPENYRVSITTKLYQASNLNENQATLKLLILSTTFAPTISTIPDDRVKFFEMYDNNTLQPPEESRSFESRINDTVISKKNIYEDFNSHVNRRHCDSQNETKYEKKNIISYASVMKGSNSTITKRSRENNSPESVHTTKANSNYMFRDRNTLSLLVKKFPRWDVIKKENFANWSSYPFASVYVYKPTQTHCDAAGISPHWLVAAGSCLSRHRLVHSINARSAFVTYCGEHWREPERIAYVKRSVVHPKFNPRDEVRRLLYNIGLIQVSSSMATSCPSWSPITLMSHQFTTDPAGSKASAVGWGLDRYGTKYTSESLPNWPLTVYDAAVYCGTCPGSYKYSIAKHQDLIGASNVYCLLLPPYMGEESDPVHGGLLLVDGKLVALYLQEERRSWGAQSAQYTGVWRLLPWVMDIAREPYDLEATLDV